MNSKADDFPSVAIVGTPLQFINACEFAYRMAISRCQIHVLLYNYEQEAFDILPTIEIVTKIYYWKLWTLPKILPSMLQLRLNRHLRLISSAILSPKIVKAIGQSDKLAIGNINDPLMHHCANSIPCRRLFILDDGFATLNSVKQLAGQSILNFKLYGILAWLLRINLHGPHQYELFTSHDVKTDKRNIIKNQYSWIKGQVTCSDQSNNRIWILGQPIPQNGVISEHNYLLCLRKVVNSYSPEKKICYIMHPGESYLGCHTWLVNSGVQIIRNRKPIELHLASCNSFPHRIAAFYSSAVLNCKIIFGNKVNFDIFDLRIFMSQTMREAVDIVYESLSNELDAGDNIIRLQFDSCISE